MDITFPVIADYLIHKDGKLGCIGNLIVASICVYVTTWYSCHMTIIALTSLAISYMSNVIIDYN